MKDDPRIREWRRRRAEWALREGVNRDDLEDATLLLIGRLTYEWGRPVLGRPVRHRPAPPVGSMTEQQMSDLTEMVRELVAITQG